MVKPVPQAVYDLQASFRRIQTLLEWRNLEMAEPRIKTFPRTSVARTKRALSAEIGRFWELCQRVENSIVDLPKPRRESLQRWMTKLQIGLRWQLSNPKSRRSH